MRKLYLFLSLALLFCSVSVTWGRIQKKDPQQTTLGIQAPADGMMLAFNRIAYNASGSESNLWLCASSDEAPQLTVASTGDPQSNSMAWILEASDVVIEEGVQSFYLKNLETDSYLYFVGSSGDSDLALGNKSEAKSFIIVPTKQGVPLMGSEQTDFEGKGGVVKDGDWMILSKVNGEFRNINTFAGAGSQGFMGIYADYASWYTAYEVETFESTIAELQDALEEMPALGVKGGTAPGCYPATLVEEYTEARAAVYDLTQLIEAPSVEVAQAAIARLRAADAAIKAASRVPLTTGFYRIVSALPAFEQLQGIRYAMGTNGTAPNWSAYDTELDAQVWSITSQGNDSFTMQNIGNSLFIIAPTTIGTSQPVNRMGEEPTDNITITFFDNASSARIKINGSADLHANGHSAGAGTGNNIVFWNGESNNASAWFFEPVTTEEEAKFTAMLEQNKLTLEFNKLLAEAQSKYDIAAVYKKAADAKGLITEVEQLSSNADHNAFASTPDGQGLAGLIDDDIHTFFHSLWYAAEGAPAAYHNLTVDLKQPLDKFAFSITPRKYTPKAEYDPSNPDTYGVQNQLLNRPTEIVLYGAVAGADIDDPASWEKLRTITDLPSSNVRPEDDAELPFTSAGYPLLGEYQYLRFEVTKTNNGAGINVGGKTYPFFTMAEFQIFNAELDETSQMAGLGEVGTAFEEALKQALKVVIPTQADIDALRAALQAFVEGGLVDPTELKVLLEEAHTLADGIVEAQEDNAKQPGLYPAGTRQSLVDIVAVAQVYCDAPGKTAAGLKQQTETLSAAMEAAREAVYGFDFNTWYRIRHCTLWYQAIGHEELQPEDRTGYIYSLYGSDRAEDNGALHYGMPEDLPDISEDQYLWRLVQVGDSAVALQCKATGLFMGGYNKTHVTWWSTAASLTPALFNIECQGFGSFSLTATELDGSSVGKIESVPDRNILHAAVNGRMVVYWNTKGIPELNSGYLSSDSGANWEFVPAKPVEAGEMDGKTFVIHDVEPGVLQCVCYPFSTTLRAEGLKVYEVAKVFADGEAAYLTEIAQDEINLEAGQPVCYTVGGVAPYDYEGDGLVTDATQDVCITINTDFVSTPQTVGLLNGLFRNGVIPVGSGVPYVSGWKNVIAGLTNYSDYIHTAYIAPGLMPKSGLLNVLSLNQSVDLRISSAGFATLMLPYDAVLPAGVNAYSTAEAGPALEDGRRVLTLVKQESLQANTPYIIKGEPGIYRFCGDVTHTQNRYSDGWLTGTFLDMRALADTYVLQNNEGRVGFYHVAEGREPSVSAYRAWLSAPEGEQAEVAAFLFADDATGVNSVEAAADRLVNVYTIDGVRVRSAVRMPDALKELPRGVYVIDGVKQAVQ